MLVRLLAFLLGSGLQFNVAPSDRDPSSDNRPCAVGERGFRPSRSRSRTTRVCDWWRCRRMGDESSEMDREIW